MPLLFNTVSVRVQGANYQRHKSCFESTQLGVVRNLWVDAGAIVDPDFAFGWLAGPYSKLASIRIQVFAVITMLPSLRDFRTDETIHVVVSDSHRGLRTYVTTL